MFVIAASRTLFVGLSDVPHDRHAKRNERDADKLPVSRSVDPPTREPGVHRQRLQVAEHLFELLYGSFLLLPRNCDPDVNIEKREINML